MDFTQRKNLLTLVCIIAKFFGIVATMIIAGYIWPPLILAVTVIIAILIWKEKIF